ncbi:hypothetical protein [Flavobacterium granuli]|uniref:Cell division protein FtsB n=1 Tax=Flavobacterium granuli TaxID=280093 RepID=A0ABU1S0E6_9FLAO|nr:hypothetical protein [Flavobacterium granuli]MDR6844507.1 cell division protein FtsB [Flavobacterium granuli]
MKTKVITFFQNLPEEKHEQFNEAFQLYRESPTKSEVVERTLNAGGYSERVLENLLYDLQKMHGITDVEKVPVISLQASDDGLSDGYKKYMEVQKSLLAIDSIQDLIDWAIKRQAEFQDVDYLLGFAISDKDEEVIEILTIAWESLDIDTTENENVKKLLETKETEKWNSLDSKTAAFFASFLAVPAEELKDWVATKEFSPVDLQNYIETADNAGISKVYSKLKLCVDYVISLDSDENLFLELKPVFEKTDEELFAWAIKRQAEHNDVHDLLELAIDQEGEKAIEVLTKAWEYLSITLVNQIMAKKEVKDINVVTSDIQDNAYVKELTEQNENLALENQDLEEEKADLENEKEELEAENEALKEENQTLKLSPKIDNQSIRVEFPFLNNADCPDEFKILIADKITAWNRYLELQEQIADAGLGKTVISNEDLAILGNEAVKCFDENQKIYDELNAYQTTGKVLGVHPIFRRLQLTREVEVMTPDELHNFKGSSAKYFSDNRKQLAKAVKAKNEERILEINTRVADREVKLALVNKTLGISPK